jgi:molecular chaperone Hsp33
LAPGGLAEQNPLRMSDRLCRGFIPTRGLRAAFVRVGDTARMSRVLHGLEPTSARAFAQALAAGALLGSLQKDRTRINLQLSCDGPLVGLLVDADAEGNVRGYVRAPAVHFAGDPEQGVRASLGGRGFLSVLRERIDGGPPYRSSVELEAFHLAEDLRRWFAASEQVATALELSVLPRGDEPLGEVGGVLIQRLPDGDDEALAAARERLAGGALARALAVRAPAQEILTEVGGGDFDLVADMEIAYRCGCSAERARMAVSALGRKGVAEVLAAERQATVTCEFCRQRYVLEAAELEEIARGLAEQDAAG